MGTRSGDLDPAVMALIAKMKNLSTGEVETMLNKKSGLLGLCGENDMRLIGDRAAEGDKAAQRAIDVCIHRLRKYIGAYIVALDGVVDAIVFTAVRFMLNSLLQRNNT